MNVDYKLIADCTIDWEFLLGPDNRPIYHSPSVEQITGYPSSVFFKETDLLDTIIHPDDRKAFRDHNKEAYKHFQPNHLNFRIITKNNQIRWIEHICQPAYDKDGKFMGIRGSNRDITKRIEMVVEQTQKLEETLDSLQKESALRKEAFTKIDKQRKRLLSILDGIDDLIYVSDPDSYELLHVNEKMTKLFGKQILGKKCYKVLQNLSEPCSFCTNKYIFGAHLGNVYEWEFQNMVTQQWFRCADKAIEWVNGKMVRFEIANDITELKHINQKIRENEFLFRSQFDYGNIGIAITSSEKGWLKANRKLCDMLGYQEEELTKLSWDVMTYPEDLPTDLEKYSELMEGKIDGYSVDKRFYRKDQSILHTHLSVSAYRDDNGKPLFVIASILDISSRKKAEAALIKTQKALIHDQNALKRKTEELKRSNHELEQFAYVASHDLQEPLRMVGSYVQLLEKRYKGQLDQDATDFIQYASDGARRMQILINDLLAFSRIESRGKQFEKVDIQELVGQTIINLSLQIKETRALITNDDLPVIMGDKTQMLQVFQNLIGNAIKFSKKEHVPKIHISVEKSSEFYTFSFKDNGIGIEPDYFDKIFIIFQRLHDRSSYKGTGIGLAITKRIIERHHGSIWVKSKPGQGSTFLFTIPINPPIN